MTNDHLMFVTPAGEIKDNYGTTTLVNNTLATRTVTVPTGKRWFLYAVIMLNADNVIRTCGSTLTNASAQVIGVIDPMTALAVSAYRGVTLAGVWPLKAGDYITFQWNAGGASAGGTATSAALVIEVSE